MNFRIGAAGLHNWLRCPACTQLSLSAAVMRPRLAGLPACYAPRRRLVSRWRYLNVEATMCCFER